MTGEKLQRTVYRDPNTPDNRVRTGTPTLAENGQDMDQYYRPLERIHGSSLHGWGVASGLEVSATLNDAKLTLQPGVALDSRGQHISLAVGSNAEVGPNPDGFSTGASFIPVTASGVVLPTTGITGDKYLTIQFWETFDSDSFNTQGAFRYWHTPWLQLVDVAAFTNNGSRIVLAKVSFGTAGQVTVLSQDLRQATVLPVGGVHLQRPVQSTAAGNAKVEMVEAGTLQAHARGGLDLTVANATDEIHVERSDGGNLAKVSLAADHIVARQGNGQESVIIDTAAGSISATNVTVGNVLNAASIGATNVVAADSVNTKTLLATDIEAHTINADLSIRQNSLYMGGGLGWSSMSYNAHHNEDNTDWVFPDPSRPAVTIEMDDSRDDAPRFQVWSTIPGNHTGWQERFAVDGNSGSVWAGGSFSASGSITASSSISANGEVVVKNAPGAETIVLNANAASLELGAPGTNGSITVYDKSHNGAIILNGDNGKITAKSVKTSGIITAQVTGGAWALGGFASQGAVGVRAANGDIQADLATDRLAGDFKGGVNISGALQVSGPIIKHGGGFKIDHPLDPDRKYLSHSFVESPDMKNIYDGVAVFDGAGEACVELPEWFAALNRDIRYQLTCIGDYAPVYIARKVQDNCFTIAGGKPAMEVSWQVTGVRQDAWACANRICTEEEKPLIEQGS